MANAKNKKKKSFQFPIWWQSTRFRFVAATVVLIFITAVGTYQTASEIGVISEHQMVSKASNLVLSSTAKIQAAVANEQAVIYRLKYYDDLPEDNRDFLIQLTKKEFIKASNRVQSEQDQVEKLFNDFDKSTASKIPILSGFLSIRSSHHRVVTNFYTFESMIDQQRHKEAKKMFLATCESTQQLQECMQRLQQHVVKLQRISTAQAVHSANSLSWFSSLGWGCTALITFCLMIANHVKEYHSQNKTEDESKVSKPKPISFKTSPAKIETKTPSEEIVSEPVQEEINYSLADLTILIAEDGLHNRRFLKTVLDKNGAKVHTFENGQEAVDFMATEEADKIDLMLIDVQMPVMDGIEAITTLRQRGAKTKAIAITALDAAKREEDCLEAGFDAYITKPIEKNRLVNAIGEILKLEPMVEEMV